MNDSIIIPIVIVSVLHECAPATTAAAAATGLVGHFHKSGLIDRGTFLVDDVLLCGGKLTLFAKQCHGGCRQSDNTHGPTKVGASVVSGTRNRVNVRLAFRQELVVKVEFRCNGQSFA